jgi:cyclomaltodextrinase / maltogenic alpha-amylase / neopullulanase
MDEYIFGQLARLDAAAAFLREERQGVRHGANIVPRLPGPSDTPLVSVAVELDLAVEQVICSILEPQPLQLTLERVGVDWDVLNWRYMQLWQTTLPAYPTGTVVRYRLQAMPTLGGEPIMADDGALASYVVGDYRPPEWADEAIIYQIFPDRFHPGKDGPGGSRKTSIVSSEERSRESPKIWTTSPVSASTACG